MDKHRARRTRPSGLRIERGSLGARSVWKEKERLKGKIVETGVIILDTVGCRHFREGGCSMCGYNIRPRDSPEHHDLSRQFSAATGHIGEVEFLKIYTSGSFLDREEVPEEIAKEILTYCSERHIRLLFETRPEYVTSERISWLMRMHDDLEIALGLESSNDMILRYSINKGFTTEDYDRAADEIKELGAALRTYVLLKPPFITEAEAIADTKATIKYAARRSDTISVNPVNVQKGTLVEKLWRTWAYRPPWLWSALEVLKASEGVGAKLVCEPTGGGKERGAHNCGNCDGVILDALRRFSLSQDRSDLGLPECECMGLWKAGIRTEQFVVGGTCDLQRFFRPQRA